VIHCFSSVIFPFLHSLFSSPTTFFFSVRLPPSIFQPPYTLHTACGTRQHLSCSVPSLPRTETTDCTSFQRLRWAVSSVAASLVPPEGDRAILASPRKAPFPGSRRRLVGSSVWSPRANKSAAINPQGNQIAPSTLTITIICQSFSFTISDHSSGLLALSSHSGECDKDWSKSLKSAFSIGKIVLLSLAVAPSHLPLSPPVSRHCAHQISNCTIFPFHLLVLPRSSLSATPRTS